MNKILSNLKYPYYIFEINTSHFGNLNLAKKMVKKAKEIGSNCVKFQSWKPQSLYTEKYFKDNPISERFFQKYSLSEKSLLMLANYAKSLRLDFSSTPYSNEEVDFLVDKCKARFVKIASMDLNNIDFLKYIAKKRVAVVLSTGMGNTEEIKEAVKTLKRNGNKELYILHCVSVYPTPANLANLRNILGLKKLFPKIDIGFSDHTIGAEFAVAAVACGAKIIEKHFTLDNNQIGMDNNMAAEPLMIKRMINECNQVYLALGKLNRSLSEEEKKQKKIMRRSIFAANNIKKGQVIKKCDLAFKRPGSGIPLNKLSEILGKKVKKNISKDQMLDMKYLIK